MADDAEKLYNISLCKIAESRSIRRGGTSLHKHLLISTVLTKTRSAIFDTWYMGDGEVSYNRREDGSVGSINLNASFQESDFPLDDSDDDDDLLELGSSSSSTALQQVMITSSANHGDRSMRDSSSSSSSSGDEESDTHSQDNNMIDPRFFVEVESEIELPSDILNCVEKLGDISEHMSFTVRATPTNSGNPSSASSSSLIVSNLPSSVSVSPVPLDRMMTSDTKEADSSRSVVIVDTQNNDGGSELTYLDLDSSPHTALTDFCDNENNNNNPDEHVFGHPLNCSTPNPSKRRRGWSLEEDEDSGNEEDNEESNNFILTSPQKSRSNCSETSPRSGLTSMTNLAKRLRFSPECEEKGPEDSNCSNSENKSTPVKNSSSGLRIIDSEFRTKKSHFEEDEQEESSEDDPFLGDALGQGPLDGDYNNVIESRDRRVPSASSSSGSSSDEDESSSMEVDQITNLVQFISFSKSHHNQSSSSHSNSSGSSSSSSGLVRSMSSPDLCGLTATSRVSSPVSSISPSSKSANHAKDLYSFVSSANNSHISSHRVLTMTV